VYGGGGLGLRGVPPKVAHGGNELKDPRDAAAEGGRVGVEVFRGDVGLMGESMLALDGDGYTGEGGARAGEKEEVQRLVGVKDRVDTYTHTPPIPYVNQLDNSPTVTRGCCIYVYDAPIANPNALLLLPYDKFPQWRYKITGVNTPETIHLCVRVRAGISSARKRRRIGAKNLWRVNSGLVLRGGRGPSGGSAVARRCK